MLANVVRTTVARRASRTFAPILSRGYSENSFDRKEKAHEDQFARKHEQEQLAKLRKEIEEKQAKLKELEAKAGDKPKSN